MELKVVQDLLDHKESGPKSGGATYIRWGKCSCPTPSGEVYTGIAAGSEHRTLSIYI